MAQRRNYSAVIKCWAAAFVGVFLLMFSASADMGPSRSGR
jgi:hypothetical protein